MTALTYTTRTQSQYLRIIADAVISRELEYQHYQLNIDNYEDIIQRLPSEWPEHLKQFRNPSLTREQLAAHVPEEDHALVVDLFIRDQLAHAVKVERHAQRIVKVVYDSLVRKLPPMQAERLIAEAAERHQRRVEASERQGNTINLTVTSEALKLLDVSDRALLPIAAE